MGFRFRRSIRLGKGLRINLRKSGASLSVGRRGATVNFGPKGEKVTVGLPGTGLSYSEKLPIRERRWQPSAPAPRWFKITVFFLLAGMAGTAIAALLSLPR